MEHHIIKTQHSIEEQNLQQLLKLFKYQFSFFDCFVDLALAVFKLSIKSKLSKS